MYNLIFIYTHSLILSLHVIISILISFKRILKFIKYDLNYFVLELTLTKADFNFCNVIN